MLEIDGELSSLVLAFPLDKDALRSRQVKLNQISDGLANEELTLLCKARQLLTPETGQRLVKHMIDSQLRSSVQTDDPVALQRNLFAGIEQLPENPITWDSCILGL